MKRWQKYGLLILVILALLLLLSKGIGLGNRLFGKDSGFDDNRQAGSDPNGVNQNFGLYYKNGKWCFMTDQGNERCLQ